MLNLGMTNTINYKIIEDFVATIYSTDITHFGTNLTIHKY